MFTFCMELWVAACAPQCQCEMRKLVLRIRLSEAWATLKFHCAAKLKTSLIVRFSAPANCLCSTCGRGGDGESKSFILPFLPGEYERLKNWCRQCSWAISSCTDRLRTEIAKEFASGLCCLTLFAFDRRANGVIGVGKKRNNIYVACRLWLVLTVNEAWKTSCTMEIASINSFDGFFFARDKTLLPFIIFSS